MASGLALRGFQAVPCSALPLFDRLTACLHKGVLILKLPESQSAIEVIQRFPRAVFPFLSGWNSVSNLIGLVPIETQLVVDRPATRIEDVQSNLHG